MKLFKGTKFSICVTSYCWTKFHAGSYLAAIARMRKVFADEINQLPLEQLFTIIRPLIWHYILRSSPIWHKNKPVENFCQPLLEVKLWLSIAQVVDKDDAVEVVVKDVPGVPVGVAATNVEKFWKRFSQSLETDRNIKQC